MELSDLQQIISTVGVPNKKVVDMLLLEGKRKRVVLQQTDTVVASEWVSHG